MGRGVKPERTVRLFFFGIIVSAKHITRREPNTGCGTRWRCHFVPNPRSLRRRNIAEVLFSARFQTGLVMITSQKFEDSKTNQRSENAQISDATPGSIPSAQRQAPAVLRAHHRVHLAFPSCGTFGLTRGNSRPNPEDERAAACSFLFLSPRRG